MEFLNIQKKVAKEVFLRKFRNIKNLFETQKFTKISKKKI